MAEADKVSRYPGAGLHSSVTHLGSEEELLNDGNYLFGLCNLHQGCQGQLAFR